MAPKNLSMMSQYENDYTHKSERVCAGVCTVRDTGGVTRLRGINGLTKFINEQRFISLGQKFDGLTAAFNYGRT